MLTQRNLYILPTKAGLVFAATLCVMLVAKGGAFGCGMGLLFACGLGAATCRCLQA